MAVLPSRVTVTTTATKLNIAADSASPGAAGQTLALRNTGAGSIFVGQSTVTATTGFEVPTGATLSLDLDAGEVLYGITASSTADVHVLQQGA